MEQSDGKTYKIRLAGGRVLGPLDIRRVRQLILKNHVVGTEVARIYPDGEWKDVNTFPEIAELLLAHAQGQLKDDATVAFHGYRPIQGDAGSAVQGETAILPGAGEGAAEGSLFELPDLQTGSGAAEPEKKPTAQANDPDDERTRVADVGEPAGGEGDNEKTIVASRDASLSFADSRGGGPAQAVEFDSPENQPEPKPDEVESSIELQTGSTLSPSGRPLSEERTIVLSRDSLKAGAVAKKAKWAVQKVVRTLIAIVAVALLAHELFLAEDAPKKQGPIEVKPIRAELPSAAPTPDPQRSIKVYTEAMGFYVLDTVEGYRKAADKLRVSSGLDPNNVKALAMLASCYINLIDNSNKDENYFSVISKLIDLSRAKAVDLPETIIADVEFYVTVNKPEVAQSALVDFTKKYSNFDAFMFYYLAYVFYHRGDLSSAARYLGQYPDNKVFSAKVFYLRGKIAEALGDPDTALIEYRKALEKNKDHARSHVRVAEIMNSKGKLKDAARHVEFAVTHAELLPPKDIASALFLRSLLSGFYQKWALALADVENAIRLDKGNSVYLVEYYTLKAKTGSAIKDVQKDARMYFFLGEGEKALKAGNQQEALTNFLRAREANLDSPLPPIKAGDMFLRMNDVVNAKMNYELAAQRAPKDIEVWSKYIDVLIRCYEWEAAQKGMDKFRVLPVPQSSIDKAAADMYAKQGQHTEAQIFYKKAMARESIDPGVYIAYAKSLMEVKNFKDAPFFFALALRLDPLNTEAIIGTAKCMAATESIDRAITMLEDEVQKGRVPRAELLGAIAELEIQRGEWDRAQRSVDQAREANPDYAYPWKLQAQIYLNKEGVDKQALDKALAAFKSYSDRNASDPSGYMERYRVFIKKTQFEKASEELSRIYAIYPKFPNLHFYKGALYTVMGNHKAALDEYAIEVKNNPRKIDAVVAMGKELIELGDAKQALDLFNKAMQLNPMNAEAKLQSAWANHLLKNYAGAVALYRAALALDKGNPLIYKRMGMTFREMGDHGQAAQAFRKYLEMEPDAPDKAEFQKYL